MAKVARQTSRRNAIKSVFSGSSFSNTINRHSTIFETEVDVNDAKRVLRPQLCQCLGIGPEAFTYGGRSVLEDAARFHLPISACPSMFDIRAPTEADNLAQQKKWSKSPVWTSIKEWQNKLDRDAVKRLVADVLDELLPEYVKWAYKGCYRADVVEHLQFWVRFVFAGLIRMSMRFLDANARHLTGIDARRWEEVAMTRLGSLRVDELFDIVVNWDRTVHGIDDLRHFVTGPATRFYLTTHFSKALSARLLHPGSSTIKILQIYISIIRAFRRLDPKGILLDRVSRRLRRYLRERDDTVKVIVSGLLSSPVDEHGNSMPSNADSLSELALELSRRDGGETKDDDGELDWDNMEWMPDPIDFAPDSMKSKNTDVVGSLTSLFESKDIFVKELQTTLADRLLKNKPDFDLEINIIEHLKSRFGDAALQGCEVMLRDVLDSRKVDHVIRKEQTSHPKKRKGESQPELHAKILSRLFWPSMPEQEFHLPASVQVQQQLYEKGFEALKNSRKLTWLPFLGQVEVELHLTDRSFSEEVLPYQATVVYAFQDLSPPNSVSELSQKLSMAPSLVRSACIFWVSKRVLTETSPDAFEVLETLPSGSEDISMANNASMRDNSAVAAAEAAAAQAAKEAEEEDRKQKMAMYHQFIVSMLTNQGAMPLPRIAMMLGIVVPGGFPFSNEELKEFMGGMVKEGVLEVGPGGNWKVTG